MLHLPLPGIVYVDIKQTFQESPGKSLGTGQPPKSHMLLENPWILQ